jgi:ABC-type branched-subunit amino acid transport system ATPase component
VRLDEEVLTGRVPHQIAKLGVARSFQDLQLFDGLSVRDNVACAGEGSSWFWQPGGRRAASARRRDIEAVLERTGLAPVAKVLGRDISYAERKFLSLARVIGQGAKIWLLDEPASGLDPASRTRFVALLKAAVRDGITICLIEHNLDIVVELADRIVFLDRGRKLTEGAPSEIMGDPALAEIYFGSRPQ